MSGRDPQVLTAAEAVATIPDGASLLLEGSGGGLLEPDTLLDALGERYRRESSPRDLDLTFVTAIGDNAGSGIDRLAQPGMVRRAVGGMWGKSPAFAEMAIRGDFAAYNVPQGVLSQLCRDVAAGRPGLITATGLGTFCDPRLGGGRLNDNSPDDVVELLELDGREWLRYLPFAADVAFIRGSYADEAGNVSFEDEPARLEALAVAQAASRSGGRVIVQVKRIVERGSLDPRLVVIPGILVWGIVVAPEQRQLVEIAYDPGLSGAKRVHRSSLPPLPLSARKIVARRALAEIRRGDIVNLGVGMAAGVASVAVEEGRIDDFTLTVEQGLVGGIPASGLSFGVSWNPDAIIDQAAQFDFYDGGGLDVAFLGMGQVDAEGNVNVSRFGDSLYGTGGFVNISQHTTRVVFCGTFTSGGLEIGFTEAGISILTEGRHAKFVEKIQHVTFNGARARTGEQSIMFVTERAVLALDERGLVVREVAPGIDLERDVLDRIPFPVRAESPVTMDIRLFSSGAVGR